MWTDSLNPILGPERCSAQPSGHYGCASQIPPRSLAQCSYSQSEDLPATLSISAGMHAKILSRRQSTDHEEPLMRPDGSRFGHEEGWVIFRTIRLNGPEWDFDRLLNSTLQET